MAYLDLGQLAYDIGTLRQRHGQRFGEQAQFSCSAPFWCSAPSAATNWSRDRRLHPGLPKLITNVFFFSYYTCN